MKKYVCNQKKNLKIASLFQVSKMKRYTRNKIIWGKKSLNFECEKQLPVITLFIFLF